MVFRVGLGFVLAFVPAVVLGAGAQWRPLLTAETIGAWTNEGQSRASYVFADGVVTGQPIGHNPKNSFLCSPREYHDFELNFSFRITPASLNSGVQFRSHVRDDGVVAGPQLEMEVEDPADISFLKRWLAPVLVRLTTNPWRPRYWASGGVYGESLDMGWIYPGVAGGDGDAFAEQGKRLTEPDGWNELRLRAQGPNVKTWLNGEVRAEFTYEPIDPSGLICLQVHGGDYEDPSAYQIEWKDLRIRESGGTDHP